MNFAELIAARKEQVDALEKRMAAKPTGELADKLGKATLAAQIGRIEQRIARLDQQRTATIARIDTALEAEHAALSSLRKVAADTPPGRPDAAEEKTGVSTRGPIDRKQVTTAEVAPAKPA